MVKYFGLALLVIARFSIWPIMLFVYKNLLKIKIKIKHFNLDNVNYLAFIQKYLPSAIIVLIIIIVTTNNIFAQNYSSEEYANRTLLSSLITSDQEGWSELIEDSGAATGQINVSNYLEDQGSLQELVINNPFEEETPTTGVSPDSGNLVLLSPEDSSSDILSEDSARRSAPITYVVQAGDVLGKIAEKFNISINTILWENDLNWSSTIRPGQKLTILPDSGINYEIKSGDTILAIAKKYQVDAEEVVKANKLADAGDIQIGDLLFIPNGVQPTQVVSSYKAPTPVYSDEPVAPAQNVDTGTKLLWPVLSHRITQYYHWGHSGLDIGDKTGNPIYAAESGKVERSGWSTGYGYNVVINHGNGIKTLYGHASKLLVSAGDTVSRGQTIALIGSTGWSTGPHLHMEVRVNDVRLNPLNYIK